jgi:hypothetical protein
MAATTRQSPRDLHLGEESTTFLLKAAKARDPGVRFAALAALSEYRHRDEIPSQERLALIGRALRDKSPDVRIQAASLLGRFDCRRDQTVIALVRGLLKDNHGGVREAAKQALVGIEFRQETATEKRNDGSPYPKCPKCGSQTKAAGSRLMLPGLISYECPKCGEGGIRERGR